jgi:hypothetical protein
MAEQSAVTKNLERISYGVAGFVALVLLALPFLLGGGAVDSAEALKGGTRKLNEKLDVFEPKAPDVPRWDAELKAQWDRPALSTANPSWVSERAPVLARRFDTKPPEVCVHEAGEVSSIECLRDPEKKVLCLKVSARMSGANKSVAVKSVVLLKKTDDGDYVEVPGFSPSVGATVEATGSVEYTDFAVEPRKRYSYRIRSSVEPLGGCVLNEADKTKESAELGPTPPCPHELFFEILAFEGNAGAPQLQAKYGYYDYSKGKVLGTRSNKTFAEGEKFGEADRYEIKRIELEAEPKEVHIKDTWRSVLDPGSSLIRFTQGREFKGWSVASWPPVVAGGAAAEAEAAAPPAGKAGAQAGSQVGKAAPPSKTGAGAKAPAAGGTRKAPQDAKKPAPGKTDDKKADEKKPDEKKPEDSKPGSSSRRPRF